MGGILSCLSSALASGGLLYAELEGTQQEMGNRKMGKQGEIQREGEQKVFSTSD